jgi:ADP-ribosylglycohydrolase
MDTDEGRFYGVLLGTAVGDALGLAYEGMSADAIARVTLKALGFVSDDTEQSALVAECLARHPTDPVRAFRRALLGWFLRMPWGIGLGTLRACVRIALGFRRSGVASAGNGAAMRAAIVGAWLPRDGVARHELVDAFSRVTHVDPRAVAGARFVADLVAACIASPTRDRAELVRIAAAGVDDASIAAAIAAPVGNTGFIVDTIGILVWCFVRHGDDPKRAIECAIRAGGDTDTHAAIVGACMGALHGAGALPAVRLPEGGLGGTTHLRTLASALRARTPLRAPTYSWIGALVRNFVSFPIVLAYALVLRATALLRRGRSSRRRGRGGRRRTGGLRRLRRHT